MKIFIATFSQERCSKAASINPRGNAALHYLHPQNFASRSCLHGARRRSPFKLSPRPTRWLTERVIVINGPARRLRNLRTMTVQSSRITKHTTSRTAAPRRAAPRRGLFRDRREREGERVCSLLRHFNVFYQIDWSVFELFQL